MPKAGSGKGLHAHFPTEHASMYGLKIMERCPNTSQVISVRCQFCIYFGPETDPAKPRQRAAKTTKMAWTRCFRTDHYQKHLTSQHPSRWATYQACSYDEKTQFFDNKVPLESTMLAHINTNSNATPLKFKIYPPIVDTLISDMFFHPDDQGGVTQKTALKLFNRKDDHYEVVVSNPVQFELVVAYMARGISFRQCEGLVADTKAITGASQMGNRFY